MLERARASTSSEYALRYCADACCRRKSQMHAVFIVPIPRRSRSGEGDARLVALVRIFTHVHVGKSESGRNLPPAPASGTRRQKSGCGATAELTTTIFRSPPASTTLSTLRRRRVSGSRPPRPVCSARRAEAELGLRLPPAARRRNSRVGGDLQLPATDLAQDRRFTVRPLPRYCFQHS